MPFKAIRAEVPKETFAVSAGTISRTYDRAHPAAVQTAADAGARPGRGAYSRLTIEQRARLRKLLEAGDADQDNRASRVYRDQRKMRNPAAWLTGRQSI